MNELVTSFFWWLKLSFLGIVFFPLTKLFFLDFFDFGFPFSKVLALVFLSYSIYVLGTLKILSFSRLNLFFLLFIFLFFNLFLLFNKKTKNKKKRKKPWSFFLVFLEEFLFFLAFFFWVFIRSQEPSIRSLEKFMDFGFINSILRAKYFPPLDMWYSADNVNSLGYPINYYYFGHLTGAVLIKLFNVKPAIGYNLILATIFALGITLIFSFVFNLIFFSNEILKKNIKEGIGFGKIFFISLLGALITNLGGNLHTVYLFTKGYPNENPIPFWKIISWFNPSSYWYPNATRFIPYTIHEFPSYSYVVADLHGHVFDIPFVILTLFILFRFFLVFKNEKDYKKINWWFLLINVLFIGFMIAINYMTNAFDGPIYFLLAVILLFLIFKLKANFFYSLFTVFYSFLFFSLPFSFHFKPFVGGIGVNCAPSFLVNISYIKPFLFEKGNCQNSPFWMLFLLWGFFWISFLIFLFLRDKKDFFEKREKFSSFILDFILVLFSYGTFLVLIPEFFYIKDIYPAHFRANTMFKLGYQAFIMMSIASIFVFYQITYLKNFRWKMFFKIIFTIMLFFVLVYPFFAIPSYYGNLKNKMELDGSLWLNNFYPQDKEIIDYLNKNISGQPVILEAQGDSYTDYERISAFTGLPTVAGWWVHEWLWRGSSDVVGKRIPEIVEIYEGKDLKKTYDLLKKYHVKYVIVSNLERQKYPNLNEEKFSVIGKKIFESSNKLGALYQIK